MTRDDTGGVIFSAVRTWPLATLLFAIALTLGVTQLSSTTTVSASGPPERWDQAPSSGRPNVVVFMVDDMRADEVRWLPAVQALRRRGVTFRNARSADSLCCPARATFLTGKVAHGHQTIGNDPESYGGLTWFKEHNDVNDLIGPWLQDRGYRTLWFGKYLNERKLALDFDQPGWTTFATLTRGIYNFHDFKWSINGKPRPWASGYREIYQRKLMLREIDRFGPQPNPYFIVYNSLAPHSGYVPDTGWVPPLPEKRYQDTVRFSQLRAKASVNEKDLSDKPQWVRDWRTDRGVNGFLKLLAKRRAESLKSVNDTVARTVAKVRSQGELSNTLFVFLSDNGMQFGEHGLSNKNRPYEESTQIPLIMAGPGFTGGQVAAQQVAISDVTATVLRSSGVQDHYSYGVDGVPLQPMVGRPGTRRNRPILLEGSNALTRANDTREALPVDNIGRFQSGVAWRWYTYIEYETGEREFYNLKRDPLQLRNAYNPTAPPTSVQQKMAVWLRTAKSCAGPTCNVVIPPGP